MNGCGDNFLGFPKWYEYIMDANCEVKADFQLLSNDTWLVGAAILEILLRLAVIVAFIFVIVGGYRILASGGNSDNVSKGSQTITKALTGFIIAIIATNVVSYLASELSVNLNTAGLPTNSDSTGALQILSGLAFRIATGLTVYFVALSGYHFATAGGDPQKVSRARSSIINALIGLAVTLAAAALVGFIGGRL